MALKYQWKRDGVSIAGATSAAYQLVAADAGRKISVTVTGSKSGYKSVSKTSASTSIALQSMSLASVPTITGNAVVGSRLLANAGAWS
ncbi:hypothetical protein ACTXJG_17955, partial [Glutamicibacter arilaitensis]